MTSSNVVDGIVRELSFGAAPGAGVPRDDAAPAEVVRSRFAFEVDFDSTLRWPDVPYDTASPAARHDEPARPRLRAVLDDAARSMALRVPAAFRLVDTQLQRVLLRRSDTPSMSASHRGHVGTCLLTNLDQPAEALQMAIEALVHESIHQLLYRTETREGHFCDLAETPTFRSPWTGARLPMHSLVHACFVWFGLLTLWCEIARDPSSDAEAAHARSRVSHCLFGFAFLDDLLGSPGFTSGRVDPNVLAALRGMSARTRRATRVAEPEAALRQVASARASARWPAALAASLAGAAG
jgi:hypothetical protein